MLLHGLMLFSFCFVCSGGPGFRFPFGVGAVPPGTRACRAVVPPNARQHGAVVTLAKVGIEWCNVKSERVPVLRRWPEEIFSRTSTQIRQREINNMHDSDVIPKIDRLSCARCSVPVVPVIPREKSTHARPKTTQWSSSLLGMPMRRVEERSRDLPPVVVRCL